MKKIIAFVILLAAAPLASAQLKIQGIVPMSEGMKFSLSGLVTDENYIIQHSSDLKAWGNWAHVLAIAPEFTIQIISSNSPPSARWGFYRLVGPMTSARSGNK